VTNTTHTVLGHATNYSLTSLSHHSQSKAIFGERRVWQNNEDPSLRKGDGFISHSGGGTCRNRALGDTFLKFGMELEQAMRFSKTTGYKLTHAAGGCSCEKTKRPTTDIKYAMHRLLWIVSSSIIPILCYF